jgi:hypothetical protein
VAKKSDPIPPYPTGWIEPANRTQSQHNAHGFASQRIPHLRGLFAPDLPKGTKIILSDFWKHADVIADVGRPLVRILQHTGSCVWAGGTSALKLSIASQRIAGENPHKALEPFTLHNYAQSRAAFGDMGEGEGSLGSTFAASLETDGVEEQPQDVADKLPDYVIEENFVHVTAQQEMRWSSARNPLVREVLQSSSEHKLGSAAEIKAAAECRVPLVNGYGLSFACNNFVGNGKVVGSGENAYVRGKWDGRGGHQQFLAGYWEHPKDGPLYAVGNNWPDSTYPRDPAGLPLCFVWATEADVAAAMRLDGEVYAFSRLNGFPTQPKVLDFGALA